MRKTYHRRIACVGIFIGGVMVVTSPGLAQEKTTRSTALIELSVGEFYDFDDQETGERSDADIRYVAGPDGKGRILEPLGGAGLGVIAGNRQLYETCAANTDLLKASRINTAILDQRTYLCVRTSEDRIGVFKFNSEPAADANTVSIGYTVWERPGQLPDEPQGNSMRPVAVNTQPAPAGTDDNQADKPDIVARRVPEAAGDNVNQPVLEARRVSDRTGDDEPGLPNVVAAPVQDNEKDEPRLPDVIAQPVPDTDGDTSGGPDLPGAAYNQLTVELECPDADAVSDRTEFRTGENEAGWNTYSQPNGPDGSGIFDSTSDGLFLRRASLTNGARTFECHYAELIRVDYNHQITAPAAPAEGHPFPYLKNVTNSFGADGYGFSLSKTNPGACTQVDPGEWDSQGNCTGRQSDLFAPLCPGYFFNGGEPSCFTATRATCAVTCPAGPADPFE